MAAALLLLTAVAHVAFAQQPSQGPADRYEPVYEAVRVLAPDRGRVALVKNLTLRRDRIELQLQDGALYLATPVAGRTVAAVFVGTGSVGFAPAPSVERAQIKRVLGDSTVNARITAAALLFSDSTAAELQRQLTFAAHPEATAPPDLLNDVLDFFVDKGSRRVLQRTLMADLLNGATGGFFFAHVKRVQGEDLMFMVDPQDEEPVQLLRAGRDRGQRYFKTIAQLRPGGAPADPGAAALAADSLREPLRLDSYRIDATMAKNLNFSATAAVRFTARRDGVRWVRFWMYSELKVDSIRSESADTFYRADKSPELWVRLAAPLRAGETHEIRVSYHGDLIGFGSIMRDVLPTGYHPGLPTALDKWLFVKSSSSWFPRYGVPFQPANVELTFRTPKKYHFSSIGQLMDTKVEGDVQTTRWVTERPTDQVCFNVGEFDELHVNRPGLPPVTVQTNADAHRQLNALILGPRAPEEDVGADVANSLAFFSHVFGPPLFQKYYATEIPFSYGQAFPGLVYLSVWTFSSFSESGGEEMFRSHEIAHQWWGIGVDPASYRDRWISEGFAEFSGLWYMQMVLKDNDKFFKQLREWRKDIRARRDDAPPMTLGPRVVENAPVNSDYYNLMIYRKGAWTLHMLRNMMLDYRTMNEDAFIKTMQDFYTQYRGRRATTQDFQRVVERHTGVSMDWFFNQWVHGTAVPTYTLSWRSEPQPDGRFKLSVRVRQADVPADFMMPVPLQIEYGGDAQSYVRILVKGDVTEANITLPSEPRRIQLNPFESVLAEVKTEEWR